MTGLVESLAHHRKRRFKLGPDPELLGGLMDQHPLPSDDSGAFFFRVVKQTGLLGVVDGIHHDGRVGQGLGVHRRSVAAQAH